MTETRLSDFQNEIENIKKFLEENKKVGEALQVLCEDSFVSCTIGEKLLDSYIKLMSKHFFITEDSLYWFIYDNDCGIKNMKCYDKNDKEYVISDSKTFLEFEDLN